MKTWHVAQVSSFCLAAYFLEQDTYWSPPDRLESPWLLSLPRLWRTEWFIFDRNEHGVPDAVLDRLPVLLHTFANRVVAYFCLELRAALVENHFCTVSSSGFRRGYNSLPATSSIPFSSFMKLPAPFMMDNLALFGTSHLATMTDPKFLASGEWTGYYGFLNQRHHQVPVVTYPDMQHGSFFSIGGPNVMVELNGLRQSVYGLPPVESTVRFHFVDWIDHRSYVMQSNHFHTELALPVWTMIVERDTGLLHITSNEHYGGLLEVLQGVITPFGIVASGFGASFWWLYLAEHCPNVSPSSDS
jgi:hypothetical protein